MILSPPSPSSRFFLVPRSVVRCLSEGHELSIPVAGCVVFFCVIDELGTGHTSSSSFRLDFSEANPGVGQLSGPQRFKVGFFTVCSGVCG